MPILFMALIALAVFGAIGIMLFVAGTAERRYQRAKTTGAGAPLPAEPGPAVNARGAAAGR